MVLIKLVCIVYTEYPSRSRKLVENLSAQNPDALIQNLQTMPVIQTATSSNLYDASNLNQRLIPMTKPKYSFPIKRVFLTRESKERTAMNNGNPFGIQIMGGQPIENQSGVQMLGAIVTKIQPGTLISTLGELKEGDVVLEFNGIPLTGLRNNDVQQIIMNSFGLEEVELCVKDDRMPNTGGMQYNTNTNLQYLPNYQQQQVLLDQQQAATQLIPTQIITSVPQVPIATTQLFTVPTTQLIPTTMTLNPGTAVLRNPIGTGQSQTYLAANNQNVFANQTSGNLVTTNTANIRPFGALNQQPQTVQLQAGMQPVMTNQLYQTNQPTIQTTGQQILTTQQMAPDMLRY